MDKTKLLNIINKALTKREQPDFSEYDSDDIYYTARSIYYDESNLFEESIRSANMSIEKADVDKFSLRIKGPAKYYSINGLKVIFGPYDKPIIIDNELNEEKLIYKIADKVICSINNKEIHGMIIEIGIINLENEEITHMKHQWEIDKILKDKNYDIECYTVECDGEELTIGINDIIKAY